MPKKIDPINFSLTKQFRLAILILSILIFFIATPITIFYTAGYRYSWEEKKIKPTGVVSIDVKPKDADVILNGNKINKKIPIRLTNRAPGNYQLIIKKTGYKSWEKEITIYSNQTTFIKDITLFKETGIKKIITEENSEQIIKMIKSPFYSPFLIIKKNNDIYEIFLYSLNSSKKYKEILVFRGKSDIEPIVDISPYTESGLIIFKEQKNITYEIFSLNNPEEKNIFDFIDDLINYQWDKNKQETIYLKQGNSIYALDKDSGKNKLADTKSNLWYVDVTKKVWEADEQNIQEKNNLINYNTQKNIKKIIDANKNFVIVQTENEILILKIIDNRIKNVEYLPTNKIFYQQKTMEWITWSDWELWSIYEDGNYSLLNRSGEIIEDVSPLDQFGVLLIKGNNKLFAFNPGYHLTHQLFYGTNIIDSFTDIENRKIFFTEKKDESKEIFELEY